MQKVTQAVILSAGLGTRLRPITDALSKVMVPILGKPLLERNIEQFKKHGVNEFFINLFHLPDTITNYLGDGTKWGVKIKYVLESKIQGTAGGVKNFEDKLGENFFVIYGDIFSLVNYSKMKDFINKKGGIIGMELIGNSDHPFDSDLVEVDENLKFLRIYPKPHRELPKIYKAMKGVYIFNRKILDYIPAQTYYEIDHQLLPKILEKEESFYGYECDDYLKDVGTPERYKEVVDYLSKKN